MQPLARTPNGHRSRPRPYSKSDQGQLEPVAANRHCRSGSGFEWQIAHPRVYSRTARKRLISEYESNEAARPFFVGRIAGCSCGRYFYRQRCMPQATSNDAVWSKTLDKLASFAVPFGPGSRHAPVTRLHRFTPIRVTIPDRSGAGLLPAP